MVVIAKAGFEPGTSSLSVVMGWWPTPAHENVAWSPGDVGFAWCS